MRLSGVPATLRRGFTLAAVLVLLMLAPTFPDATREAAPSETRALWVLRTSLGSPESITTLVRTARDHGFNTLLVQVRGRGDAYFTSTLEPRAADLQRQPASFDPLATGPRQGSRRRAARARLGERQPRLERRRPADRSDAPRVPASRVADGPARSRAGVVARRRKRVRPMSASSRGGLERRPQDPPRQPVSKVSTRRRSFPQPPITSMPSCAIS